MGGFHPTAMPEEALDYGCADLVVIGALEATFRELVEKGPSRDVTGLVWKENSDFVYTGMRELIMDVDSTRPPRFGEEIALIHDPKKKKLLKIRDANFLTNIKRARRFADFSAGSRSVCFSGAGEPEHGKGGDRIGDLWGVRVLCEHGAAYRVSSQSAAEEAGVVVPRRERRAADRVSHNRGERAASADCPAGFRCGSGEQAGGERQGGGRSDGIGFRGGAHALAVPQGADALQRLREAAPSGRRILSPLPGVRPKSMKTAEFEK